MSDIEKVATPEDGTVAGGSGSNKTSLRHKESSHSTLAGRNRNGGDTEHGALAKQQDKISLWAYLNTDVDPAQSTGPLSAFCFMTGYMYVLLPLMLAITVSNARIPSIATSSRSRLYLCGVVSRQAISVRSVPCISCPEPSPDPLPSYPHPLTICFQLSNYPFITMTR